MAHEAEAITENTGDPAMMIAAGIAANDDTELYDASHAGLFANVGAGRSYMLTATYRYE